MAKNRWVWILVVNLMLIAIFTIFSLSSLGMFSIISPNPNEIVLTGTIDDSGDIDMHQDILIGNELISFVGNDLVYSGSDKIRVDDNFLQSKDLFLRTMVFRGTTYKLHPYDTIKGNYFTLTYVPEGFLQYHSDTKKFETVFNDRFLLSIDPDGLVVTLDKNIQSKAIGDDIILNGIITNNLFDGISGGIEYKVSSFGLFQQTVGSAVGQLNLGSNGYKLTIPNEAFGKKVLELNKIITINGKSYKIDEPEQFNFKMGRDGIIDLVTNESYTYLVGNDVVTPEPVSSQQGLSRTTLVWMGIIGTLVTGIITYVSFRRKK